MCHARHTDDEQSMELESGRCMHVHTPRASKVSVGQHSADGASPQPCALCGLLVCSLGLQEGLGTVCLCRQWTVYLGCAAEVMCSDVTGECRL